MIDLNTNFRLSSKKLSPPKNTVSSPKDHLTPNYRGVIHPSDPLGNKLAHIRVTYFAYKTYEILSL